MKVIKIIHPTFGNLQEKVFEDSTQFKIYLKMVHSCLELKQDFTTSNGNDFLLHIPYDILKGSIVIGEAQTVTLAEYAIQKSKMEK